MKKALHSLINNIFATIGKFKEKFLKIPEAGSDLYQKGKPLQYERIFIQGLRFLFVVILGVLSSELLCELLDAKTINLNVTSSLLYYLCSVAIVFFGIALIPKIFIHSYRISIKQIELYVLVSTFYLNSRLKDVYFIGVNENGSPNVLYYEKFLDFLIIILGIFMFGSILNYCWPKFGKTKNYYLEDNPLEGKNLNEAELKLIEKLNYALLKDKYEKSFSIGVIGTWGIGKSSFMKLLLNEIQEQQKKYPFIEDRYLSKTPNGNMIGAQRIEVIQFSPFLNHNEETVINEFFLALSNVLNKYSGKLSTAVKEYSEQLTNFIDDNKVVSVISLSNSSKSNDISVDEHYNEVNRLLAELELKVIVFIDDLDRLNPQEILQVLKLIRNTSNFKNFVFVVAMDKEYVVNSLRDLGEYTGRNYIDKFFQLECFLPEIEHSNIVTSIIENIQDSEIISRNDMPLLLNVISNELYLLSSYIHNYREVKSFVNQIHFEYNNVKNLFEEVSVKDYLNLLLLKTHFPQYYRLLILNYDVLLEDKKGILGLRTDGSEGDVPDFSVFELDFSKYTLPDTSKYEFGLEQEDSEEKKSNQSFYSKDEITLIKSTVYEIFQSSQNPPPYSLKRVANFKKVAYWRIATGDLDTDVYKGLIKYYIDTNNLPLQEQNDEKLKVIIDSNKVRELIVRMSFEVLDSEPKVQALTRVCFNLLGLLKEEQQGFVLQIHEILDLMYNKNVHHGKENQIFKKHSELLKRLFESHYIDNSGIDLVSKISLINRLKDLKDISGLWGYQWSELIDFEIKVLRSELSRYTSSNWLPNDYQVFRYFLFLRDQLFEEDREDSKYDEVKEMIIDFLKKKNFAVLFFNLLNPDSSLFAYRFNNLILFLFETMDRFVHFIDENYRVELSESHEKVKKFIELMGIVQNQQDVKMDFPNSVLLGDFSSWGNYSDIENKRTRQSIQIFVKCNLKSTNFNFKSDEINFHRNIFYSNDTVYWYFASNRNHTTENDFKQWILESFASNITIDHDVVTNVVEGIKLIDSDGNTAAEIISIQ